MSLEPSPKQALALWSLVVVAPGEEPSRSTCKPKLSPAERKQLINADLIEEEKRGRVTHLLLTDKGWEWAGRQTKVKLSLSTSAAPVLEKLIQALSHYLVQNNIGLAEVITHLRSSQPATDSTEAKSSDKPPCLLDQIREAYLAITVGEYERRVRLAELRQALPTIPRESLDAELRQLDRSRAIQLMTLEQGSDITAVDRVAALSIAGRPMHVMYLAR